MIGEILIGLVFYELTRTVDFIFQILNGQVMVNAVNEDNTPTQFRIEYYYTFYFCLVIKCRDPFHYSVCIKYMA